MEGGCLAAQLINDQSPFQSMETWCLMEYVLCVKIMMSSFNGVASTKIHQYGTEQMAKVHFKACLSIVTFEQGFTWLFWNS